MWSSRAKRNLRVYIGQLNENAEGIRNMVEWKGIIQIAKNFEFDVLLCSQLKINVKSLTDNVVSNVEYGLFPLDYISASQMPAFNSSHQWKPKFVITRND